MGRWIEVPGGTHMLAAAQAAGRYHWRLYRVSTWLAWKTHLLIVKIDIRPKTFRGGNL